MANRTISVTLIANVEQYRRRLREAGDEARRQADRAAQAFARHQEALDKVGKGALVASGVMTAAFATMVKASADFEQQMSQVQYVSKATASQMTALRGAAFDAGKAFGLSASQVADAELELSKAGVSAKDIIGGALPGALALASAGQLDVAKATSIASTAMTQFGKSGKDVPHIADLLAASADRSVGSVESVGDALNQSGLVAAQFGLSIEDTVGTLTSFSKAGLNGSDAGTSFKTMLLSLASPSKQAQEALDRYNISAYDSKGAFVGITSLAGQLQAGFKGVDQASRDAALSTIFGTDAVRAANVLYKQGVNVTMDFADAQTTAGAAMQAAQAKLNNLNGDLQRLSSSVQNNLIRSGATGQEALRGLTQGATGLVDVLGSLPQPVQAAGLALTGVGAAATGIAGGFLVLAPKVVAARTLLSDLNVTTGSLRSGLRSTAAFLVGPYGAAFAVGTAAMVAFEARQAALLAASPGTTNALITQTKAQKIYGQAQRDAANSSNFLYDALTTAGKAFGAADASISSTTQQYSTLRGVLQGLQTPDFGSFLSQFAPGKAAALGPWKDAFTKLDASLTDVNVSAVQAATGFQNLAAPLKGNRTAMSELLDQFPKYRAALVDAATAQGINVTAGTRAQQNTKLLAIVQEQASSAAKEHAQALKVLAGGADQGKASINALSEAIKNLDGGHLSARAAARAYEQAIDDATAAAKKNATAVKHGHDAVNEARDGFRDSTAAGRDAEAALDGIASAAQASAQAYLDAGGSAAGASKRIQAGKTAYTNAAVAMGLSQSAAKKLADSIFNIPKSRTTNVSISGAAGALMTIANIERRLRDIDGSQATVYIKSVASGAAAGGLGAAIGKAAGGSIEGPGPKGRDSVLVYAAPGEHVLTAREVDRMGGQGAVYAFRRSLMAYADGGAIEDAKDAGARAKRDARRYQAQVAAAQKTEDRLQKAYDAISGREKDRARKRAAKTRLDAAHDRTEALQKQLDKAKSTVDSTADRIQQLQYAREDFISSERRGGQDGLGYIDQLRSMSRSDDYSDKRRKALADQANKMEAAFVRLGKESDAAASKLSDLKSSADSMRSSLTSSIAGGYQLGNVSTSMTPTLSGWVVRNGVRFRTTGNASTSISADAVDRYYSQGAGESAAFAAKLKRLAAMGIDPRLLAELAGKGVAEGGPYADALLSATSAQIGSINAGYSAIQDNAAAGAAVVTDANYKALIDSAQANADQITKQIASDSDKLRKLIATAFGVSGYAIGTKYAAPGWHWTGENGRELVNFGKGGGQVLNASQTRYALAGTSSGLQTSEVRLKVSMPTEMNLVDANHEVIGRVRTEAAAIAEHVVDTRNHAAAVALLGGATR